MSGSPATGDRMPLIRAASLLIALSNASGPSRTAPVICFRSAILHSAAASRVAGILEVTVSTAARIATFGRSTPSEIARSMAFWQMSILSSSVGAMLIARVGDDEDLVIGGNVHDEHVTDAAARAQAGLARDDRAQQLVGVQAALHQELGLALANELHRFGRRAMAVRSVDDLVLARGRCLSPSQAPGSLPPDPRESARSAPSRRPRPRRERRFLAGMRHRGRHRLEASAPRQQQFVLSGSSLSSHGL